MQLIDTLISSRWVVPIEPENTVYENYTIAIHQGKIVELLSQEEAKQKYTSQENIELDQHVVLPGLVNAHTHTPMSLFRGMADDLPLMTWLEQHIWPSEKKWLSEAFCYDGALLAIAEMIRGGTTCFSEHYFFLEGIGRAAVETGMRACLGVCVLDFPTAYANSVDEYMSKAEQIYEDYKFHPLITMSIAPHAPYTVSDETFIKVKNFSEKYQVPIHIHLHEAETEILRVPQRPAHRLYHLGILSPRTKAIHMTQVNEEDIALLSKTGTHVIVCPESNLKLASGFCPIKKLMDSGINVGIGTDGAASNNDLDMLGEMRTAALLAKGVSKDPTALPAFEVLKMATLNSAKAMGLAHQIGSLLPHKSADVIAIDLSFPCTQPVYGPISQIVYAANSQQVSDVWIAGKRVLKNHQYTSLDVAEILKKAQMWRMKIKGV